MGYKVILEESNQIRKLVKAVFLASVLVSPLFIANSREENKADGWKTYRDKGQGFEIKYPAKLIRLSKDDQRLKLLHSIPFEHPNPCDFDDTPDPPLSELVDFNIGIEVLDKNLKGAIVSYETSAAEYFLARLTSDSVLQLEPGYIDTLRIGPLAGYRIPQGVEGYGRLAYYFPLRSEKTLVVTRARIIELDPIIKNYIENRKLPGVIPPEKEEELFNRILSTFKFRK